MKNVSPVDYIVPIGYYYTRTFRSLTYVKWRMKGKVMNWNNAKRYTEMYLSVSGLWIITGAFSVVLPTDTSAFIRLFSMIIYILLSSALFGVMAEVLQKEVFPQRRLGPWLDHVYQLTASILVTIVSIMIPFWVLIFLVRGEIVFNGFLGAVLLVLYVLVTYLIGSKNPRLMLLINAE